MQLDIHHEIRHITKLAQAGQARHRLEFTSGPNHRFFLEPQRSMSSGKSPSLDRIVSLDQFRGYTVLGMFVVNFVATGFPMAVLWIAYLVCDRWGRSWAVLTTLGTNALAAYLLHLMVANSLHRFMPQDSPAWYMWGGCALFLLITWVFVRALQRSGIYIRI